MNFPIEDVIRNARHFLTTVKKATGNLADKDVRQSKGGPKPGLYILILSLNIVSFTLVFLVNSITRVVLSSTQGPGIQISDI